MTDKLGASAPTQGPVAFELAPGVELLPWQRPFVHRAIIGAHWIQRSNKHPRHAIAWTPRRRVRFLAPRLHDDGRLRVAPRWYAMSARVEGYALIGTPFPVDIVFASDGETHEIQLLTQLPRASHFVPVPPVLVSYRATRHGGSVRGVTMDVPAAELLEPAFTLAPGVAVAASEHMRLLDLIGHADWWRMVATTPFDAELSGTFPALIRACPRQPGGGERAIGSEWHTLDVRRSEGGIWTPCTTTVTFEVLPRPSVLGRPGQPGVVAWEQRPLLPPTITSFVQSEVPA